MIIAVLADIHGNAAALDAVLADLPSVDAVVCAGDLVGYYPDAAEVVERVRALGARVVRGNHELMVCGRLAPDLARAPAYRIPYTRGALSPAQLEWLGALPASLAFVQDGLKIQVRHASPWDEETYLYRDTPALKTIDLLADHWLILGHTHYPMHVCCGGGWVVNPGSVGQPRDWDPRAAYGLLDTATGTWQARRVAYPYRRLQRRLEALGWERETVALLGRTRAPVTSG